MPASNDRKRSKADALLEDGTLNPAPEKVRDPKFQEGDFFDPRDVVQVKYEMLRRVSVENASVTDASDEYGVSRPTFYQAKADFDEAGIAGLVPKKRGPRGPHKLQGEVLAFLKTQLVSGRADPGARTGEVGPEGVRPRCASEDDRARDRWKKNAAMIDGRGRSRRRTRPPSWPSTRRCAPPCLARRCRRTPAAGWSSFCIAACGHGRAVTARTCPARTDPRFRIGPSNPAEPCERRAVIHLFAAMAMTINDRRPA